MTVWSSTVHRDVVEELLRLRRRRNDLHPGAILDVSAFHILWVLCEGGPRTLRQLSEELELEQSTVNRQVNAALKHGYVERYDVAGQASRMHRATASGREAFAHDGMARVERLQGVFDDLAPGEPEELLAQLRAFNDAYERQVGREG
ncbi:MarR family winged helix-turn-helix transcriptional regulator [Gordonia shandongensis]|uniref:MarR family winged helix-turn-helix transcriptional regulator n=1 Tax=Gordonia shandongensis TaxID=376351 RepID=UPI000556B254|nr:MarR family winged helix-turn-helix transcriptional regulator [Gordonia shandongensis]